MTDIIVKDIKNGSEYYYGGSAEVSAEDVSYDNTTSWAVANNLQDAMDEVFQSVSNGKELIADAITDKGVSTSATDSFSTMASNIESLTVGGKYTSDSWGNVIYDCRNIYYTNAGLCYCFSSAQNVSNEVIYYCAIRSSWWTTCFSYNNTTKKIKKASGSGVRVQGYSRFYIKKLNDVVYVTYNANPPSWTEITIWYFDDNWDFVFDDSAISLAATDISGTSKNIDVNRSLSYTLWTMGVLVNRWPNSDSDYSDINISLICL